MRTKSFCFKMAAVDLAYDVFESKDMDPDAAPIFLTHGLFWNKFVFRDIADKLSIATKCRVYSFDLRNHGESPAPKGLTIELMAEDFKKFIRDKNIEKVNFVCHSISGTVAYLVLLDMPEVVQKMVMIDCPPYYVYNEKHTTELVVPQVAAQNRMLRTLDTKMSLAQVKSKFYALASKADKSQEYFFKKVAYDLIKVNGEFKWKIDLEYLLQCYKDKQLTLEASKRLINHELLFLRCVNSRRIQDERFDKILLLNPRSKMVTFKDTTHVLMFERPEKFVEIVAEFLNAPSDGLETRRTV